MPAPLPNEEPRIVNGRPEGQLDYEARRTVRELIETHGPVMAAFKLSKILEDETGRARRHG